jgi:hypothetical protein
MPGIFIRRNLWKPLFSIGLVQVISIFGIPYLSFFAENAVETY